MVLKTVKTKQLASSLVILIKNTPSTHRSDLLQQFFTIIKHQLISMNYNSNITLVTKAFNLPTQLLHSSVRSIHRTQKSIFVFFVSPNEF